MTFLDGHTDAISALVMTILLVVRVDAPLAGGRAR